MTDYIDRQAAIDELCDNCNNVKAVCAHYPCKQYIAIEHLPSAEVEPVKSGIIEELLDNDTLAVENLKLVAAIRNCLW